MTSHKAIIEKHFSQKQHNFSKVQNHSLTRFTRCGYVPVFSGSLRIMWAMGTRGETRRMNRYLNVMVPPEQDSLNERSSHQVPAVGFII